MKLLSFIIPLFGFLASTAAQSVPNPPLQGNCTSILVRKDIMNMSEEEWGRYAQAINVMHDRGWLEGMSQIHNDYMNEIHNSGFFMAWHRRFMTHFQMLIHMIDPGVVIPYWDWTAEWQNPEDDPVLSSQRFGGNGRGSENCLRDGVERGWDKQYPEYGCVTRRFRQGDSPGAFWPMQGIVRLMRSNSDFATFSTNIENGSHGAVHLGIGGDFSTMWAPNDALFFGHHGMVDRIWAIWQQYTPGGFQDTLSRDINGRNINLNSRLPFYEEPVAWQMRPDGSGHCYTYDDMGQSYFNRNQRLAVEVPNRFFGKKLNYPIINGTEDRMFSTNIPVVEKMNRFISEVVDEISSKPTL